MSSFAADSHAGGGAVVVSLSGDLDLATVDYADAAFRQAARESKLLVVDLRHLDFIGVVGLRLMLAAAARMRIDGGRLVVVRGPDAVQRLFELTGIDERLEIVDEPATVIEGRPAPARA